MSLPSISDLAPGIFPGGEGIIAVLFGYFDESGTDGQLGQTVIGGFVGSIADWAAIEPAWKRELDRAQIDVFHYVRCMGRNKPYTHFNREDRRPHLDELALILSASKLKVFTVGFSGDWNKVKARNPDAGLRFPTAYSFCFELLVEKIMSSAPIIWPDKYFALIFAEQNAFASRAKEIYDYFKYNGQWDKIVHFGYSDPRLYQLQAADMIAYETRRFLWKGRHTDYWEGQPLLSRLIQKNQDVGDVLFDNLYDEDGIETLINKGPRQYLKRPPAYL